MKKYTMKVYRMLCSIDVFRKGDKMTPYVVPYYTHTIQSMPSPEKKTDWRILVFNGDINEH